MALSVASKIDWASAFCSTVHALYFHHVVHGSGLYAEGTAIRSEAQACRHDLQVQLNFALDEETSKVRSVLDFVPNYEGTSPPEIFLNGALFSATVCRLVTVCSARHGPTAPHSATVTCRRQHWCLHMIYGVSFDSNTLL